MSHIADPGPIDTTVDKLLAAHLQASRQFRQIWCVGLPCIVLFGLVWDPMWTPFGLNGEQAYTNVVGYATYGNVAGPFFYDGFPPSVVQYNSSDEHSKYAYSQILAKTKTKTFGYRQQLVKDLELCWSQPSAESDSDLKSWKEFLDDDLTFSTFLFFEVLFRWTLTSFFYLGIASSTIHGVTLMNTNKFKFADLNEERRQRLRNKFKKQKDSGMLDNSKANNIAFLRDRLEFGLAVKENLDRGTCNVLARVLPLFLLCLIAFILHTESSTQLKAHTFVPTFVGMIGRGLDFVRKSTSTIVHNLDHSTNDAGAGRNMLNVLWSNSTGVAPCSPLLQLRVSAANSSTMPSSIAEMSKEQVKLMSLTKAWVDNLVNGTGSSNILQDDAHLKNKFKLLFPAGSNGKWNSGYGIREAKMRDDIMVELLDRLATTYMDGDDDIGRKLCYASMHWMLWFQSDQSNCMFAELSTRRVNIERILHEYNRHVQHWMDAGIAFYRKDFPGPHAVGSLINDVLLFPVAKTRGYVYGANELHFKKLLRQALLRSSGHICNVSIPPSLLIDENGSLQFLSPSPYPMSKMFSDLETFVDSVMQSKEYQGIVDQHQPSIVTEAEVFDMLATFNESLTERIVLRSLQYKEGNFLMNFEVQLFIVMSFITCLMLVWCTAPITVLPRTLVGKVSAAGENHYGSEISYDASMRRYFIESERKMQRHLNKHVRLKMFNVVRDYFSQQCWCVCLCSKHKTRMPRPCLHPFVEGWKRPPEEMFFVCNLCGTNVNDARQEKEEIEEKKIICQDNAGAASSFNILSGSKQQGTKLFERGLTVEALVAFTYAHDCWDWPTWRVVRDIIKPATAATRCRYSDLPAMRNFFGPAKVFVSHCWASPFGDLVAAASCGANRKRRVWIDIFAVRQWPGNKADLDFRSVIESTSMRAVILSFPTHGILTRGKDFSVVSVLTKILPDYTRCSVPKPWTEEFLRALERDPEARKRLPFKRLWCVVELAAAIRSGVPIVPKLGSHRYRTVEVPTISFLFTLPVCQKLNKTVRNVLVWFLQACISGCVFVAQLYILVTPLAVFLKFASSRLHSKRMGCPDQQEGLEGLDLVELFSQNIISMTVILVVSAMISVYHYRFGGWVSPFIAYISTLPPEAKVVEFDIYGAGESVKNLAKVVDVQSSEATHEKDIEEQLDKVVEIYEKNQTERENMEYEETKSSELSRVSREQCFSQLNSVVRSAFIGSAVDEGCTTEIVHCIECAVMGDSEHLINLLCQKTHIKKAEEVVKLICVRGRERVLSMLLKHRLATVSDQTRMAVAGAYKNCVEHAAQGNHAGIVERLFLLMEDESFRNVATAVDCRPTMLLSTGSGGGSSSSCSGVVYSEKELTKLLDTAVDCMDDTRKELVEVILDNWYGGEILLKNICGAIEKACENENPEIVHRLLSHPSLDSASRVGELFLQRALHIAVREGSEKVVSVLLDWAEKNGNRCVDIRGRLMHAHLLDHDWFDRVWDCALDLVREGLAGFSAVDLPQSSSNLFTPLEVSHILHPEKDGLRKLLVGGDGNSDSLLPWSRFDRNVQLSWAGWCFSRLLFVAAIPIVVVEIALVLIVAYIFFGWMVFYLFSECPWWSKIVWYKHMVLFGSAVIMNGFECSKVQTRNFIAKLYEIEFRAVGAITCVLPAAFFLLHDAIQRKFRIQ